MQVRVATYNLNLYDRTHSPNQKAVGTLEQPGGARPAVGQVLRELDCDVVSFQGSESGSLLRSELEREVPGRYQMMHLPGNDESSQVALASKGRFTNVASYKEHRYSLPGELDEQKFQRDLLEVDLELPGGVPFKVFTVHFGSENEGEAREARKLIKESVAALSHKNYIVMGNFNDITDSPTAQTLTSFDEDGWGLIDAAAQLGNGTATFPTSAVDVQNESSQRLDFILTSPELARKLTSVSVHRTPAAQVASGHFPLTATFTL